MSTPPATLAKNTEEIARFGQAARDKGSGRIILVPVDFSDHSAAALVHAARFASLVPAALVALHVVHDPGDMPGYYSKFVKKNNVGRIQEAAAAAFGVFMAEVTEAYPDHSPLREVARLLVVGLPVTRILEVVRELDPIMVVMGSQGRTGLRNFVLGSKAAQVIQLCPVPVTIVKDNKDAAG